jgi:hypothetical protein
MKSNCESLYGDIYDLKMGTCVLHRASPAVLSMLPCKNISHPSLVIYFFATPFLKTKSGTANWWESTDNKPPERGSSSQIIFVTLFSGRCKALLCLLPASAKNEKMQGQKHCA